MQKQDCRHYLTSWVTPALVLILGLTSSLRSDTKQPTAGGLTIDTKKSVVTVRADTGGVFGAFGHEHEIVAPVASGHVDIGARQVELRVDARALRVRDSKISDKDRDEIQETMLGPKVLDSGSYPEISFRSTAAELRGPGGWMVRGNLSLHGQTRSVAVEVRERDGHYVGKSRLKQTDFGIKPVQIAGGTVRVKDEIRVEFDIQLAR